jgi:ArsR family transcriptional regulator
MCGHEGRLHHRAVPRTRCSAHRSARLRLSSWPGVQGAGRLGPPGLLSLIASKPGGEAGVCDLVEPLGLSQPTVSHHLKVLDEAGLLERERRGVWIYDRLAPARLQVLDDALGAPTLAQPARS